MKGRGEGRVSISLKYVPNYYIISYSLVDIVLWGNARLRRSERSVRRLERADALFPNRAPRVWPEGEPRARVYRTPSFPKCFFGGGGPKIIGPSERFARFGQSILYRTPSFPNVFFGGVPKIMGPNARFARFGRTGVYLPLI